MKAMQSRKNQNRPKAAISPKADDKAQSKAFIDKARDLGCDEDETAFDERLRKIAKATPPKSEASKQMAKPRKARRAAKAS
jgi:hypothetical protein